MALQPVGVIAVVQGFGPFMSKMTAMNRSMNGIGGSAIAAGRNLTGTSIALGAVAVAATAAVAAVAGVTIGIAKIADESIETAISVESAFAGVLKTTQDLGTNLFDLTAKGEEVFQQFRDLAKDVPLAFEELADIGQLGGQLGVPSEDIADFTRTVASIAVSTNLTEEDAALGLARLSSTFGFATNEISDNVEQQASALVFLGNNYAATEQEILLASRNIAGAGAIVGASQADLFGIGATLKIAGVTAEAGGTAVQNALIEIEKSVQQGAGTVDEEWQKMLHTIVNQTDTSFGDLANIYNEGGDKLEKFASQTGFSAETIGKALTLGVGVQGSEALKTFAETAGLSQEEFITLWEEDATGAFTQFVRGLDEAGDDAFAILEELGLDSARSARTFLGLANNVDVLEQAIIDSNAAFEQNTALSREAEIRFGTLESKIQIMKNSIRDIALDIGLSLAPAVSEFIGAIDFDKITTTVRTNVIPAIDDLVSKFLEFFGLGADEGPQLGGLGILGPEAISPAQQWVNNILEPINQLKEDIQEPLNSVGEAFATLTTTITEDGENIKAIFEDNNDFIVNTFAIDVPTSLNDMAEDITTFADNWELVRGAMAGIIQLSGAFVAVIPANLKLLGTLAKIELDVLKGLFETAKLGIEGDWDAMWDTLKTTVSTASSDVVTAVETMLNTILNSLNLNVSPIFDAARSVGAAISQGFAAGMSGSVRIPGVPVVIPEDVVGNQAESLINEARQQYGIRSPSSVFMKIGQQVSEGLALGISQGSSLASDSIQSLLNPLVAAQPTVLGSSGSFGGATDNSRSITVNANYFQTQAPNEIVDDLALVSALGI